MRSIFELTEDDKDGEYRQKIESMDGEVAQSERGPPFFNLILIMYKWWSRKWKDVHVSSGDHHVLTGTTDSDFDMEEDDNFVTDDFVTDHDAEDHRTPFFMSGSFFFFYWSR
jgi:hypothetical protein